MTGNAEFGIRNAESRIAPCCRFSSFRIPHSAFRIYLAAVGLLFFANVAAAQQPEKPQLIDVHVGVAQHYKLGCWTPVELVFQGGTELVTGIVELTVRDADDIPVRYTSGPAQLTPGRATAVTVYAKFGRPSANVEVVFRSGTKVVLRASLDDAAGDGPSIPLPTPTGDRLILCIGRSPTLDDVAASVELRGPKYGNRRNVAVVHVDDPLRLPARWYGYESFDAVVLLPKRVEDLSPLVHDSAQIAALLKWVRLGGRLWTATTLETMPLFAAGATLGDFAPGLLPDTVPLSRTAALEKFAGSDVKQAIAAATLRKFPLVVPRWKPSEAVIEAADGDVPLVQRRAVGFGSVVVTAFHPEHPLLADWNGRTAVVRKLLVHLGVVDEADAGIKSQGASSASHGYDDLAGQLRSALDQYPGVQTISFFTLALMVIGYLVLIGPVDYLLVRRVFKRPELTWITFPTMVVATAFLAYYLATWMKGSELRVSQADVVDCDAATGTVRGTWWAGVFSPVGRSYDVEQEPLKLVDRDSRERLASWFGLPGNGFGGMNSGGTGGWFGPSYEESPDNASLGDLPIQVWSSKMLAGRSVGTAAAKLHEPLRQDGDGRLRSTLKNPFPFALQNVLLCYGKQAYQVGKLEAGGERDLAASDVRDIQLVLQGWHAVVSQNKSPQHVGRPHDPGSSDVNEILRKMMFYAAAGGYDHADLDNRFQSFVDLSHMLTLHRAVLIAEIDPANVGKLQLTVGGSDAVRAEDRRTAFVRLVIPVSPP